MKAFFCFKENHMIKVILFLAFIITSVLSFSQQSNWCGTDQIIQRLKATDPGYEEMLHKAMSKAANGWVNNTGNVQKSALTIPVVVHIIHDNGIGNISNEQVQSALDILNQDYNRQNPDTASTRNTATAPFRSQAGVMDVEFVLAKIDPNGNCTNGIVRVNAPNLTYNTDDACKYAANGGSDQWNSDQYLNIWIVNSINSSGSVGTILGYAYYPYGGAGSEYGILMRHDTFGTIETANSSDGRTLTHEMGHALGLAHIFDQGCHSNDCNQNGDYCCDTPPQAEANWSCSQTWNSCNQIPVNDDYGFDALDQIENYMSYNACQNMFSRDQAAIMQQNFIDIAFLANMVTPQNNAATGVFNPEILCKADFEAYNQKICVGDSIQFIDRTFFNPIGWMWSVSPGVENVDWEYTASTNSMSQNPVIRFFTQGVYQITLESTDGVTTDTEIKSQYITILPSAHSLPYFEGFEGLSTFNNATYWFVDNFQNNNTFVVDQTIGSTGSHSAKLMNFGQSGSNSDELVSTAVDLSVLDPINEIVTLSFKYAYRKRYASNDEWLKVFISNNCSETWAQRKTIHGNQLSPIDVNASWSPSSQEDWTTVHMTNITPAYFVNNFRFKFEFEGQGGNNFYLDDINLYAGPPSNTNVLGIAEVGEIAELSLYPNPTDAELNLRFTLNADQITHLNIQDITGKTTAKYVINAASGSNNVIMETESLAAGVYFVTIKAGEITKTLQFVKN